MSPFSFATVMNRLTDEVRQEPLDSRREEVEKSLGRRSYSVMTARENM